MSLRNLIIGCFFTVTSVGQAKVLREPQQVGGDIGMRGINVLEMTLKKATIGTSISFDGQEATSFYSSLPKSIKVDDPEEATGFIAKDKMNTAVIKCVKNKYNPKRGLYEALPNGPHCTISIGSSTAKAIAPALKWISEPNQ